MQTKASGTPTAAGTSFAALLTRAKRGSVCSCMHKQALGLSPCLAASAKYAVLNRMQVQHEGKRPRCCHSSLLEAFAWMI